MIEIDYLCEIDVIKRDENMIDIDENSLEQYFINEQSDFYQYLIETKAFQSKQTYKDYLSRLRYVSRLYKLDRGITDEYIRLIVDDLTKTMDKREHYKTKGGISDLAAGLRKFLEYAQSDYRKIITDSVFEEEKMISSNKTIKDTEKEQLINSRRGQGIFRQNLIHIA